MKKEPKKDYVWYGTRIGFYFLIAYLLLSSIFDSLYENEVLAMILTYALISTFVTSIVHLTKYKNKSFAIIALVISSLGLIFFSMGFIIGLSDPSLLYKDEPYVDESGWTVDTYSLLAVEMCKNYNLDVSLMNTIITTNELSHLELFDEVDCDYYDNNLYQISKEESRNDFLELCDATNELSDFNNDLVETYYTNSNDIETLKIQNCYGLIGE